MTDLAPNRFYAAVGGRKQFNSYLFSLLITAMAIVLHASFEAYAAFLGGALLGTHAATVIEDHLKRKAAS